MYPVKYMKDVFREQKAVNDTSEIQQHMLKALNIGFGYQATSNLILSDVPVIPARFDL